MGRTTQYATSSICQPAASRASTAVASTTNAHLVPFFLEGVALEANMIQSDGIHPTTLAQPVLLETGWQALVASVGDLFPEVVGR